MQSGAPRMPRAFKPAPLTQIHLRSYHHLRDPNLASDSFVNSRCLRFYPEENQFNITDIFEWTRRKRTSRLHCQKALTAQTFTTVGIVAFVVRGIES